MNIITIGFLQFGVLTIILLEELVKNRKQQLNFHTKVGWYYMCEKSLHPK